MSENYSQKIAVFQDSVLKEADEKISRMITDAKNESERLIEKAKDDYLNESYRWVSDGTKMIKNSCRRRVSKTSFDSNREVLTERNRLIKEFFDFLEEKLKKFVKDSNYSGYFKNALKTANGEKPFYEGVTVQVSPVDFEKTELFSDFPFLKTESSRKIKIGGLTIYYPNEKIYIDLTLDKKLKTERDDFVKNSELILLND